MAFSISGAGTDLAIRGEMGGWRGSDDTAFSVLFVMFHPCLPFLKSLSV